jgi:3-oxoacyl-[acyl-carrier protein] reductase
MEQNVQTEKKNKLALITGASRGIGAAIASAFAADGFDLVLTCNNSYPALQKFACELENNHNIKCTPVQCDMGNSDEVDALFSRISSLDVLINNAGISHIGLLNEMSVEDWHHVLSVNLDSLFYTCKHAIPLFLQTHAGCIINISSVWGSNGASMEVAYSASKGGVNAFTKALAKELAPSNIPVNAIACGVIDTSMNNCFSEEEREALQAEIPADRFGQPEEVARLVLQTAKAPTYMTGQIITIDGGWY